MTAEPALKIDATYPCKNETKLWRDEKAVSFQVGKIKCRSNWCPNGCAKDWIKIEAFHLSQFDPLRTRHLILTTDLSKFNSQQEMYEYFRKDRPVAGLIRNFERGKKKKVGRDWVWEYKPMIITNYRWYLEWYVSGAFHLHLFIEVEKQGHHGMIGQERIHHYWNLGEYIREEFIRDKKHWFHIMGDFQKTGYFYKNKSHQSRLPDWALNIPGYTIRRSSGKRKTPAEWRDPWDEYCKRALQERVDPATGEILANLKLPRGKSNKTYAERHEGCGQRIFAEISNDLYQIKGVFNIPWADIKKTFKGTFEKGRGYVFRASVDTVLKFLSMSERIISLKEFNPVTWSYERVGFLKWAWCLQPGITKGGIYGRYKKAI